MTVMQTGIRQDSRAETPRILDRAIDGKIAWRSAELRPEDWLVPLTDAAIAELDTVARGLSDYDGAIEDLRPDPYDWPATLETMVAVRSKLENGVGFAVLDRLPVERWGIRASTAVSWLLNNHLAPAIKQKWKGARVYDVRDTGAKLAYGVRRSTTNLAQEYHTDGSFLTKTPEMMGLACLRQAEAGGMSRLASLATVHNLMLERHPDLLPRLYRPFWWDRQAEHAPDEVPANALPIYEWYGERLRARYYDDYIRNGQRLVNAAIDTEGDAALAAMQAIIEEDGNGFEFRLEPGQIEFCNNHLIAHGRTGFRDPSAAVGGRHLLRFWLRSVGGLSLEPEVSVPA